ASTPALMLNDVMKFCMAVSNDESCGTGLPVRGGTARARAAGPSMRRPSKNERRCRRASFMVDTPVVFARGMTRADLLQADQYQDQTALALLQTRHGFSDDGALRLHRIASLHYVTRRLRSHQKISRFDGVVGGIGVNI